MQRIKTRFPSTNQIWPVFSIILFIIFSWVLWRYFFQLPSWLHYMNFSNIFILLAYAFSFALIESLALLAFIIIICVMFPAKYYKDIFVPQGSMQILIITALTYILRQRVEDIAALESWSLIILGVLLVIAVGFTVYMVYKIFARFPRVTHMVSSIADRMMVFLYIYAPLGLVGTLVVLYRNII